MCSESYEQHILQKYRLGVALAVIKEKPEDCTIGQYMELLKNKIKNDNIDDLDITICSEDFDIDSESNININNSDDKLDHSVKDDPSKNNDLKDLNDNAYNHEICFITNNTPKQVNTNDVDNDSNDQSQNSESILKEYLGSTNNDFKGINNKAENSKTHLTSTKQLKPNIDGAVNSRTGDCRFRQLNNKDVIPFNLEAGINRMLCENDCTEQLNIDNELTVLSKRVERDTQIDSTNVIEPKTIDSTSKNASNENQEDTTNDNSTNLLQGVHNMNNSDSIIKNDIVNSQESISLLNITKNKDKGISTFIIANDNVKKKRKFDVFEDKNAPKSPKEQSNLSINKRKYVKRAKKLDLANTNSNSARETNLTCYQSVSKNYCNEHMNKDCNKPSDVEKTANNNSDSAVKTMGSMLDAPIDAAIDKYATQDSMHVSQSQYESIMIDCKLIKPKSKDAKSSTVDNPSEPAKKCCDINNKRNKSDINFSELVINDASEANLKFAEPVEIISDVNKDSDIIKGVLEVDITEAISSIGDINSASVEKHSDDVDLVDADDIGGPKAGEVPFKVIKELNKVKTYLNRKGEKRSCSNGSIDSGYKSDSQGRSMRNSLQTGNWLNQSAHSLFEFMMQSSLDIKTQQITEEISKVMSQLVDRLHDEERYLSFFDDLLEIVDNLLHEIVNGDTSEENVLINKNEAINRLLLLNRSVHIQKYTIDKLTDMLQFIYTHLTSQEDVFEVSNTSKIENCAYIFHILEVVLRRYVEHKRITRPLPSSSQNELRKSSIISVWRKKWYPHIKENEGSQEIAQTKCVLEKCNAILNKMVVHCMDGYSLLSFAALQCFNLLRN